MGYVGGKARRTPGGTVTGQVRAGTGGNRSGDAEEGEDFEAESTGIWVYQPSGKQRQQEDKAEGRGGLSLGQI